jgi:Zn finger protein HypA/HybF involved in hydrogenase expression
VLAAENQRLAAVASKCSQAGGVAGDAVECPECGSDSARVKQLEEEVARLKDALGKVPLLLLALRMPCFS